MKENPLRSLPGIPFLLAVLVIGALAVWLFITGASSSRRGTLRRSGSWPACWSASSPS